MLWCCFITTEQAPSDLCVLVLTVSVVTSPSIRPAGLTDGLSTAGKTEDKHDYGSWAVEEVRRCSWHTQGSTHPDSEVTLGRVGILRSNVTQRFSLLNRGSTDEPQACHKLMCRACGAVKCHAGNLSASHAHKQAERIHSGWHRRSAVVFISITVSGVDDDIVKLGFQGFTRVWGSLMCAE